MTDRELFAQAVVALEYHTQQTRSISNTNLAIEALRARLAQPEPEPVTMVISKTGDSSVTMSWWHEPALPVGTSLYTAPPQREYTAWNIKYNREPLPSDNPHEVVAVAKREWQGMTDEDIRKLSDDCAGVRDENEFIRAIEAKLKEKNGF